MPTLLPERQRLAGRKPTAGFLSQDGEEHNGAREYDRSGVPKGADSKVLHLFRNEFSSIKIFPDSQSAKRMNVRAYTFGNSIYFASGEYSPGSGDGLELLCHELAHVMQQGAGRVYATGETGGIPTNESAELESEADAIAKLGVHSVQMNSLRSLSQREVATGRPIIQKKGGDLNRKVEIAQPIYTREGTALDGLVNVIFQVSAVGSGNVRLDSGLSFPGIVFETKSTDGYKTDDTGKGVSSGETEQARAVREDTKREKASAKTTRSLKITPEFLKGLFDRMDVTLEAALTESKINLKAKSEFELFGKMVEMKGTVFEFDDDYRSGILDDGSSSQQRFVWPSFFIKLPVAGYIYLPRSIIKGGAELRFDFKISEKLRDKALLEIGRLIGEAGAKKLGKSILAKKMRELGLRFISKETLPMLKNSLARLGAAFLAFEVGWTIGELLAEYTVAGSIALKEMEDLERFRRRYDSSSGLAGKVGWTVLYSPIIVKNLFEAGVGGAAGAAGKAVGSVTNDDDSSMAETAGSSLARMGFERLSIVDKIGYIVSIGTGFVTDAERERVVDIFEYSTLSDRLALFSNAEIFGIYRRGKLDRRQKVRLDALMAEANGSTLDIMDSKYESWAVDKRVEALERVLYDKPLTAPHILSSLAAEEAKLDAQVGAEQRKPLRRRLRSLSSRASAVKKVVFPAEVETLLSQKNALDPDGRVAAYRPDLANCAHVNELLNAFVKLQTDPDSVPAWKGDEPALVDGLIRALKDLIADLEEGRRWLEREKTVSILWSD